MKIINYRSQEHIPSARSIAIFDIEDVDFVYDGIIYGKGAYRNWELKRAKNGGFFVGSRYAYLNDSDPNHPVHHSHVELPLAIRKQFNGVILDLLRSHCPELKESTNAS